MFVERTEGQAAMANPFQNRGALQTKHGISMLEIGAHGDIVSLGAVRGSDDRFPHTVVYWCLRHSVMH
jgi:hypothetical protein